MHTGIFLQEKSDIKSDYLIGRYAPDRYNQCKERQKTIAINDSAHKIQTLGGRNHGKNEDRADWMRHDQ